MRIAIQVPIKGRESERVPGKNFRMMGGKPLFAWLLDELAGGPWDVWVGSEDKAVWERIVVHYGARMPPLQFHHRHEWFAGNQANGNHLLHQFAVRHPDYDLYLQAFVTAPFLKRETVEGAVDMLESVSPAHDSFFLCTHRTGLYWYQGQPVNQRIVPDGLPRTQDAMLVKETTGLYGITRDAILSTGCRIGRNPLPIPCSAREAIDIDTEQDFLDAERIAASLSGAGQG